MNRKQRRKAQKMSKPGQPTPQQQEFLRDLRSLTERAKEMKAEGGMPGGGGGVTQMPDYQPVPFNNPFELPLPDDQERNPNGDLEWHWDIASIFTVRATLKRDGIYFVELFNASPNSQATLFADDMPKRLGLALVAAENYINVWKQHAGEFLERELSKEGPKGEAQVVLPTGIESAEAVMTELEENANQS